MTSKSPAGAVTNTRVDAIVEFLEGAGVAFELIEHEPVMSASSEARTADLPPGRVAVSYVDSSTRVRNSHDPPPAGAV
jgi:hypothetical protein